MKKQILLLVMILLPLVVSADIVEINGIYYNLIEKTKQAEVTSNPNKYTGSITIQETVDYQDVSYSVTSICNSAFYECFSLSSVTIPNSVTSIGSNAFGVCTALTSITIPNSVTSIGDAAFAYCNNLTSATIPNNITSIKERTFRSCTALSSITIPNSVTSIENAAFAGCTALASVTILNSVTSIGSNAFRECSKLTSITIPNSVTNIGSNAFYQCSNLTAVTIGNGIKYIYSTAFASCPNLADVTCYAEKVPSTSNDAFKDSYIDYATLHVPSASVNAYKAAEPWKSFKSIVAIETKINEANHSTRSVLVKTDNGFITVEGVDDRTNVSIYTTDGKQVGSAISQNNTATIATSIQPGSIAIVKVGEKSVKVVVK